MAKALSMDLRERAVARLAAGESVRAVAAALVVAPSSVVKWSQRLRATGSVSPGQIGGHVPPKISGAHRAWLVERMAADAFTLRGLVAELAERARRYGMTVEQYKTNNVLRTAVTSRDVAELAAEMCGPLFAKTTGAQLPVDGGNERVI